MVVAENYPGNITGFGEWMQWTNLVSEGYFGVLIVFSLFIIGILAMNKITGLKESIISMGFFCALIAIFLRILNVLSDFSMWISIIILALVVIFTLWTSR